MRPGLYRLPTRQQAPARPWLALALVLSSLGASFAETAVHGIRQQAQLYHDIYEESQGLDDAALKESAAEFDGAISTSKAGETKFIWDYFPERFTCIEGVERTPMDTFRWDGGKWICGLRNLLQRQGCVVYSFGSRGDASFEKAILEHTTCQVYTFGERMPKLLHVCKLLYSAFTSLRACLSGSVIYQY